MNVSNQFPNEFPLYKRLFPVIMLITIMARLLLLLSDSLSFHSDEAVVGLMARHILQGERPVFFYGQAYMGSLDAWLVAIGFRVIGQYPLTIHIVQSLLHIATVAVSYGAAYRFTRSAAAAFFAALILAIPPVLLATYTSMSLGGYGETLLLGASCLWIGLEIAGESRRSWGHWMLLGFLAGVGWWTNALIAAYLAPIAVVLLIDMIRERTLVRDARYVAAALVMFFIGGAPWWVFALQNDFAPLYFLTGGGDNFAGQQIFSLPFHQRVLGFFFIGLTSLFGMRFPWMPEFFLPVIGVFIYVICIAAFVDAVRTKRVFVPHGRALLLWMVALFTLIFLVSRFSFDPTGRYLLPLMLPFAIGFGTAMAALWRKRRVLAIIPAALVIGYFAIGQITAANSYPGFTTQFNLDTHIPDDYDEALMVFLESNELVSGYTQYWVSFRIAFLSGERLRYSAALPYLPNFVYTPFDDRYPPYREFTEFRRAQDQPLAVVFAVPTENVAIIPERFESMLAAQNIRYATHQIGVYTIFYDFDPAPPMPPFDLSP